MIIIPVIALFLGFFLPMLFGMGPITGDLGMYLAVACLAGFDSVCGGIRSGLEQKFHNDVFVTGFLANIVIAFFLAWLGDRIGIDLFLAAVLVLGGRIFVNLSLIRRYMLTKIKDARERARLQLQQQQQQQVQSQPSANG
jgi:small basic protein